MARGGARKGAGRKKGTSGMLKEAAREYVRQYVTTHLSGLLEAQKDNAQGIKHLMIRDEKGKFERLAVTSDDPKVQEAQIDAALKTGRAFWIYTKDPSVQAFTDLMNRALDKPAEQLKVTGGDGGPLIIKHEV